MRCGLDRLLAEPEQLRSRRYGLLTHQAAITADWQPAHLALARVAPPRVLFGPEHGFYGVEQDMVASGHGHDPLTGLEVVSLYGDDESSLLPRGELFGDLDLLVIDLQDIGSRYYTFAATAVWCAEAAVARGCEVWVLDRPNPLGGVRLEGNLLEARYRSFVGAFRLPVRHGLTLGELVLLEARRRGVPDAAVRVIEVEGWQPNQTPLDVAHGGWRWMAPSPNMPTPLTALLYPGLCLIEATELSEGRGTTRPFQLVGAPYVDPGALVADLRERELPGVAFVPVFFRPQFQKHAGTVCGGVELVVTNAHALEPLRLGVHLLDVLRRLDPDRFRWRQRPYEFVSDVPAIDLLAGTDRLRLALEAESGLEDWIASWAPDECAFAAERAEILLYGRSGR